MFPLLKNNLLYLVSCIDILAVSLIIPLFNQHLQSIGISNVKIGLLGSIYSGVQFLASPIIGHMSDIYGSKHVLIASLLACACCYPVMGMATTFVSIVSVRTAIGFAKHTQLLCKNFIQETSTENEHFRRFGKLNGFTSLGYILGPLIGGYLIGLENGFTYMCYLTGVLFILNATVAGWLDFTKMKNVKEPTTVNFVSSFGNIPWSVCWDLFLLKCLSVFAMFSFYMNYSKAVSDRYAPSAVLVGFSLSLQGLIRAITAFTIHRFVYLFPSYMNILHKMQLIYTVIVISLVFLYSSNSFLLFLLFLIPLNVSLCFIRIFNHEALVDRIRDHNKGIILGAFNNVTAVCRFVLPLVSGYVIDKFGDDGSYIISIFSLVIGVVTISFCNKLREKVE